SSVPRGISMIPLFSNGRINKETSFLFYTPGSFTSTIGNNVSVSFTTVTDFPADGNIAITVNTNSKIAYPLLFRRPYWSKDFSIQINGRKQASDGKEFISINRLWKKGDKIEISFAMPLQVINGGRNYPGHVAFQRGPHVLAFDDKLNGFAAENLAVDTFAFTLRKSELVLPQGWIGGLAFELINNKTTSSKRIILVPFADASQNGGTVATWIKTSSN
ncbi:MAG: glycoside hydrolase family 127 protein, partial [Gemmatimonadaceae bacterium]|nr:glycoside hydrolase family 127 protein [Chitinophagaceae bacterium]